MQCPPQKGGPCCTHGPSPLNAQPLTQTNCNVAMAQVWRHWEREAGRLFALFWTTADAKHLRAFSSHVYAMRSLAGRRRS